MYNVNIGVWRPNIKSVVGPIKITQIEVIFIRDTYGLIFRRPQQVTDIVRFSFI